MRSIKRILAVVAGVGVVLLLAACGSSKESTSTTSSAAPGSEAQALATSGYKSPLTQTDSCAKRGGTLNVLDETDYEHLDPGIAYYTLDYTVVYSVQRPLYSFKPNTITQATPDMAEGMPVISNNDKTITIHIKSGIHFSPPVNREVTAEDVAYAIQRGANPDVANPYFHSYFESIEGAPKADGGPLKGIETPNKHTIVFHLTEPKAALVTKALVLPLSAAVPKEYAEKFDKSKPSNYADYQVATGPYMLKNNKEGKVLGVGYIPGKSATLVRNPNWNASTDFRPACLNEIDVKIGGTKSVLDRQILAGTNIVGDEEATQSAVREAVEGHKSQLEISPAAGERWIGINNKVGPFSNIDVRKALFAALPRKAMIRTRGGELVGDVATHFIYPGIPGFEKAGGLAGPKLDYDEHPEGDMAIAEKYMKLAGYSSGKYKGAEITVVGAKGPPLEQDAEIVNSTLKNLGFTTKFTLVETATMFAKYCNVPKEEIDVCPSVAWVADFADPQAVLDITFNGRHIEETGNVNWGQTNDPTINKAMEEAETPTEESVRETDWAKIDTDIVEDAAEIPWDWEKTPNVEGTEVAGVGDLWNVGSWDYSYTSLK
jgi:peptide/nickel transport system substrate-binding protein